MSHPEHDLQKAVARFLDLALLLPNYWTAVDAGAGKLSRAAAGIAKARGVKAGTPDLFVFSPRGVYTLVIGIELKIAGGDLSAVQRDAWAAIELTGARLHVARSIDDVAATLKEYDIELRPMALAGRKVAA